MYSNFSPDFLSICEYNSWKKTTCYRPFKNGHFERACTEKMLDHQYKENDAKKTYIQTIIRRELMLNALQINKKYYALSTFPSSNRRNVEDSGKVLATSVFEFYQSTAVQIYQPTLMRWLKSVQLTLSHLITTSVPRAMFTHFLVEHGLSQYYLY